MWIKPGSFCDLSVVTAESFLRGVPLTREMVERAAQLGIAALAITNYDNLYSVVPFFQRAHQIGIRPIAACRLTMDDGSCLTLLAENNTGYSHLCQLISIGQAAMPKGSSACPWSALPEHADGLICLTGGRQGLLAERLLAQDLPGARAALTHLLDLFGRGSVYVELQRNLKFGDQRLTKRLAALADEMGVSYVAVSNAHYLDQADADVFAVLRSVRTRIPIPEDESLKHDNYKAFLRSPDEMKELFADLPLAIERTVEIANRCQVTLPGGFDLLPDFPVPDGMTPLEFLRSLCEEAFPVRYPQPARQQKARPMMDKELGHIDALGLVNFFLIAWDDAQYCKREHIIAQLQGSGASSIVLYLIGASTVDPVEDSGIVLERFLSPHRVGTPDIDTSIDHRHRERVMQYRKNYFKEGDVEHAAHLATFITYQTPSALRDVAFALAIPKDKLVAAWKARKEGEQFDASYRQALALVERLKGLPHHLGQHPGGIIITKAPIASVYPVEPAAMEGRLVIQLDKDMAEDQLILKGDYLGSRAKAAYAIAAEAVYQRTGVWIDFSTIDCNDPRIYGFIRTCQTLGLYQLSSGAQTRMTVDLQPEDITDTQIQVALVRPGPQVAGMVGPYRERRLGKPWKHLHPLLARALGMTLGVIVFQDQVIQICVDVAGFDPGRAELVRKAFGKKNAEEALNAFHAEFLTGAQKNGVPQDIAEQIWAMIEAFAAYSFNAAHARDLAQEVAAHALMGLDHPLEFWLGILCCVPLMSYPAWVYEGEARRKGIRFLPFDINRSEQLPSLDGDAIRHGFTYLKGVSEKKADAILAVRGDAPFTSVADVIARTRFSRRLMVTLIRSGALDQFGERRQLLWDLAEAFDIAQRPPRLPLTIPDERLAMTPMTADERLAATFSVAGVGVDRHILEPKNDAFDAAGCMRLSQLQRQSIGAKVRVGGIMADGLRTPPTARGAGFCRLEQTAGLVEVTFPAALLADKATRKALGHAFIVVEGALKRTGKLVVVTATAVYPLAGFRNTLRNSTTKQQPKSPLRTQTA